MQPSGNQDALCAAPDPSLFLSDVASRIRDRSSVVGGTGRCLEIVGKSPCFIEAQQQAEKAAQYREPVLIMGESGVGKDLLAQAIHLLGAKDDAPYISVNCPQYREGNLTASELFGHRKGSFTGAIEDHKGAFEEADGGTIFLDEIADLHPSTQGMLLRCLATGEFTPVGSADSRRVDVRVVAATNRDLKKMVVAKEFRNDLYFRVRYFLLAIPPLRLRGDDWRLIVECVLIKLRRKYGVAKYFSPESLRALESFHWPGNVRQLISVVTMAYAMAEQEKIRPADFASQLEEDERAVAAPAALYERVVVSGEDFWEVVHRPFLARDLNRSQVKAFVRQGLVSAEGSYRRVLDVIGLPQSNYQKFMDFLRHHDLKP